MPDHARRSEEHERRVEQRHQHVERWRQQELEDEPGDHLSDVPPEVIFEEVDPEVVHDVIVANPGELGKEYQTENSHSLSDQWTQTKSL